MSRTPLTVLTVGILILLLVCAIVAYFIFTSISNIETTIAQNNFHSITNSITASIIGNLSALSNDILTASTAIDTCYNSMNDTGQGISHIYLRNILKSPHSNSAFTIFSINVVRKITSAQDFNRWILLNNLAYNKTNISIFQVNPSNGAITRLNATNSTVMALSVVYPNGNSIKVPEAGVWDIYPNDPIILDSYYNMNRGEFNPSIVNNIRRPDGTTLTSLSVGVSLPPHWLGFVVFNPTSFLDILFQAYPGIGVTVADEATVFFSKGDITQKSRVTESIHFPYRKWTIQYFGTTHINNTPAITAVVLIALIAVIASLSGIVLYRFWIAASAAKLQEQEIKNLRMQKVQYHNQHYIMHQIRNALNVPHMLLDSEPDEDNIIIKESIDQCVKLTTDVLVFEQLFSHTYIPKYDIINIRDLVASCVKTHKSPTVISYCDDVPYNVVCDSLKLREIILNGFSNACKHTTRYPIKLRIQCIGLYLLIEILNNTSITKFTTENDNMFIPSFMRKDQTIWSDDSLAIFHRDPTINMSQHFGLDNFRNTVYINSTQSDEEIFRKMCCENASSFGIGLSLVRMISKALGGDAGLELDSGYARFWSVVKISEANESIAVSVI